MREDGQSWTRVAQEMKAIEEEIRALVANRRQRLHRAVDEEMRWRLGEAMASVSETLATEVLSPAPGVREVPLLATEVHVKGHEEQEAGSPQNDHESSPTMESLAEEVSPQEGPKNYVGTRNGMEDHDTAPLEIASNGSISGSDETYSGTVQLTVPAGRSSSQALHFVNELCRHPSLRLQRLLGSPNGGTDLWVLVQEPMALKEALLGMEGVSQVNSVPAQGRKDAGARLEVRLKEPGAVDGS